MEHKESLQTITRIVKTSFDSFELMLFEQVTKVSAYSESQH